MTIARSHTPRRLGRRRIPGARALVLLVISALFVAVAPPTASQAEEEGAIPVGNFRLLQPVENMLSASSWVMATGQDPRLLDIPTGGSARSADWTSYGAVAGGTRPGAAMAPPVPFRSAAPAFSRNQIVTRQIGLFPLSTEPHIAVDPFDPEHLVVGAIDYNFPSMSSYVSFDGGETWEGPNQVRYFQEDLTAAGDPVVGFDRDGNVYMASISVGLEEFRLGSLVSATEISSIVVSKSEDDGLTWGEAVSTARSTVETTSFPDESGRERGEVAADFLDKPWMAIGPDPEDPERDIIHIAYTEFKTRYTTLYADELPFLTSPITETTIRVVHSSDGGATWSDPIGVSPTVFQSEGASEPGEEGAAAASDQAEDSKILQQMQQEGEATGTEADQTVQGQK